MIYQCPIVGYIYQYQFEMNLLLHIISWKHSKQKYNHMKIIDISKLVYKKLISIMYIIDHIYYM